MLTEIVSMGVTVEITQNNSGIMGELIQLHHYLISSSLRRRGVCGWDVKANDHKSVMGSHQLETYQVDSSIDTFDTKP